ncbi:MAG: hypothetical protein ACHQNT_12705 [Bacteroidia bacterium]
MVSIDKFNNLSQDEKAWHIWNGATFLHVREDKNFRFNLFYIGNYYVELVYNISDNQIEKINAFFTTAFLTPYIDSIALSDLI